MPQKIIKSLILLYSFNVYADPLEHIKFAYFKNHKVPYITIKTLEDEYPKTYSYAPVKEPNNVLVSKEQFKKIYQMYFGDMKWSS